MSKYSKNVVTRVHPGDWRSFVLLPSKSAKPARPGTLMSHARLNKPRADLIDFLCGPIPM